ncbi:hypothetical protein vBDshSR4C_040 [Dinoroseobacter phage vB_DshS-R4C]|nr:hypothetical protein vBDshSR4C_040 [Dinoroseobacter phage vB_DshS-R4C]
MTGACMVCGKAPAPFGMTWPGPRKSAPAEIAGKVLRLCEFGGECHAQGIARATRKARRDWPWATHDPPDLRARVAELLDEKPRAPPSPPSPPKPRTPPNPKQGSLL